MSMNHVHIDLQRTPNERRHTDGMESRDSKRTVTDRHSGHGRLLVFACLGVCRLRLAREGYLLFDEIASLEATPAVIRRLESLEIPQAVGHLGPIRPEHPTHIGMPAPARPQNGQHTSDDSGHEPNAHTGLPPRG